MAQDFSLTDLSNSSQLSFPLTLTDDTVLTTIGEAKNYFARLTPDQRDNGHWRVAIRMLNNALKHSTYLKTATMSLQTALVLDGTLAHPHPLDSH